MAGGQCPAVHAVMAGRVVAAATTAAGHNQRRLNACGPHKRATAATAAHGVRAAPIHGAELQLVAGATIVTHHHTELRAGCQPEDTAGNGSHAAGVLKIAVAPRSALGAPRRDVVVASRLDREMLNAGAVHAVALDGCSVQAGALVLARAVGLGRAEPPRTPTVGHQRVLLWQQLKQHTAVGILAVAAPHSAAAQGPVAVDVRPAATGTSNSIRPAAAASHRPTASTVPAATTTAVVAAAAAATKAAILVAAAAAAAVETAVTTQTALPVVIRTIAITLPAAASAAVVGGGGENAIAAQSVASTLVVHVRAVLSGLAVLTAVVVVGAVPGSPTATASGHQKRLCVNVVVVPHKGAAAAAAAAPAAQAEAKPKAPAAPTNAPKPKLVKVGRNDDCPCGSGKKYKRCHG
eukprot:m.273504 g.273504  ORF g.273504 m.273504 type:complete len:407 (-) comp22851_c4_seq3:334-1554(-)